MAWKVQFNRSDRSPLGTVEAVKMAIARVFPAVRFGREPSGLEEIALARKHRNFEFPENLQEHLRARPAMIRGDLEEAEYWLRFDLGSKDDVQALRVEVGGSVEPVVESLICLGLMAGWTLRDVETGELVEE